MKFKKPSESQVKDTIAVAGGAFAGGMAGRIAFGAIHKPGEQTDPKKEENAVLMKRAGLAIAGIALAMCIDGKDSLTSIAKGAGIGLALDQGQEIMKTLAVKNGVTNEAGATTTAQKIKAQAVGLNCPCDGTAMLNGGLRYASYDYSAMDQYAPVSAGLDAGENVLASLMSA
ncbi:hypothetical protein [Flavobacterium sp.]|uniref:hypothetical protein n=1 Tax=Flavobacterium sp. TaxID=239 RepID=UPI004034E893